MISSRKVRLPIDWLPRVSVISPDTFTVFKLNCALCDFCAISRPVSGTACAAMSVKGASTSNSIFRILKSVRLGWKGKKEKREHEEVAQHRQHQADSRQPAKGAHGNERRHQQHAEADHDDDAGRDHRRPGVTKRRGQGPAPQARAIEIFMDEEAGVIDSDTK